MTYEEQADFIDDMMQIHLYEFVEAIDKIPKSYSKYGLIDEDAIGYRESGTKLVQLLMLYFTSYKKERLLKETLRCRI